MWIERILTWLGYEKIERRESDHVCRVDSI